MIISYPIWEQYTIISWQLSHSFWCWVLSRLLKSQQLRDLHNSRAIQPQDIREAMRRYTQAVGPFADFSVSQHNLQVL